MTGSLLIKGATLLDVGKGTSLAGQEVLLRDDRICRIEPSISVDNAQVIDAKGLTMLPGLVDGHVHVTAASANLGVLPEWSPNYVGASAGQIMKDMLHRGFTTVRDTGGADYGLSQAQSEGLIEGPRLIFGGKAISQTGGHGDFRSPGAPLDHSKCCCGPGMARIADGVDGVRLAARDELRKGAHHLKVMASGGVASPTDRIDSTQYSMDELRAVVEEATAANRYVAAHAYTARAVNRALEAGVRSIEHGNLIDDESIALFLKQDAFLVPTLVTYWALKEEGRSFGLSQDSWEKVDTVLEAGLAALQSAANAGVRIVFGSDLLGGMHRHQSEEFRIRANVISNLDVLRSATLVAAELLGLEGQIGVIAPGAFADLILVEGDPLADIGVLADPINHLKCVIQGGRLVLDRR